MAPRTRRSAARGKLDSGLRDEKEIDEYIQQSEKLLNQEVTQQPIEKRVRTPSTRRYIVNQMEEHVHEQSVQQSQPQRTQVATGGKACLQCRLLGFKEQLSEERYTPDCGMRKRDEYEQQQNLETSQPIFNKIEDHGQQESAQQSQPQISQQASRRHGMVPSAQRASVSHIQQESVQKLQKARPQINQQTSGDVQGITKQSRGPTYLPHLWTRNSNEGRIIVDFNKKGQPIGPNKKKFTGFLGTLARNGKFTPLDIDDWRKVPKTRKDELIRMVKERFEVPKGTEHWILLSIGKKRRQWKSRVKSECFAPIVPIENRVHNRPIRVNEDQWKNLLPYWAREDVKGISSKNKDHRRCSVMQQTTGKLSFAEVEEELKELLGRSPSRVEMFDACFTDVNGNPSCDEVGAALEEMKEVQSKLPPGSRDPVGPTDSFAKVIGKDPFGRVRMVGLGVNPSDILGDVPSRSTCYRMVLENQVAMARMEEKVDATTNFIATLQEKMQQNASINVSTARRPVSPSQSSNSINLEDTFKVGHSVLLKSLFDSKKIVAKGCVRSVDPNQDVGGKRVGLNWCQVQVSVPMVWDEELIRPYSNLSTIGDAIGTCIAWPRHLVINVDDQA